MKENGDRLWLLGAVTALVLLSVGSFGLEYVIFRDTRTIFVYLFQDLGFLPIQVIIVGLVIERVLVRREKAALRHKLNMLIGAFFGEVGNGLLASLTPAVVQPSDLAVRLHLKANWSAQDFDRGIGFARSVNARIDLGRLDLPALRERLVGRRDFLVRLLENPSLLEHDRFADVLWSIFHLTEELEAREDLSALPANDRAHLAADAKRVYAGLAAEWLAYARHLQQSYPYLFSLVVRTHPFQDSPSATMPG